MLRMTTWGLVGSIAAFIIVCLGSLSFHTPCTSSRVTVDVAHHPLTGIERAQRQSALAGALQKRAKLEKGGPKRFDQPQEAWDFFVEQRRPLDGGELSISQLSATLRALEAREAELKALRAAPSPGGVVGWSSLGPGNIGGRSRALVIDPVQPDIMYAAGVTGGIWKSTDAGVSWMPMDDLMAVLAVSTIAIDANNPNVLYAGTGEGYLYGSGFARGNGIFKSTDAGATWVQLPGTVSGVPNGAFNYVNEIVISPNNSQRLYAATRTGVWRSLDAGLTWSLVLANPRYLWGSQSTNGCAVGCTDLAIRTDRDPEVVFAAFGSFEQDGLYRSDDGADTWVASAMGTDQGRMTLAIAPSNNDIMYIAIADNGTGNTLGQLVDVLRSDDGGATFVSTPDFSHPFTPWLMSYVAVATGCVDYPVIPSQGWYDSALAVDPLDPDRLWLGGIDLYRSDDGGQTFGLASYWFYFLDETPPPAYIHVDQHRIIFHPQYDGTSNQTMFVANDGGLWRTQNARAATTQEECPFCLVTDPNCAIGPPMDIAWENLNNGYGVTQYYHGDSARLEDVFAGGAQDNGTSLVRAVDTPNNWKIVHGGDGGYVAIDPRDTDRIFVEIQYFPEIYLSTNGGADFAPAVDGITDNDGLFITPLAMDQANPDVLWTGGSRPWRTSDGAASWQVAGPDLVGPDRISAIAIAPSDSNVVWLGFNNGYVARTTNSLDASPTWTVFVNGLIGGWVSSLAADPVDTEVAYLTYSNYGITHVLRTEDGGQNWVPRDGASPTDIPDVPAHWIAVRPCDSQQLYVGTELGAFASDDAGLTWSPINDGLAHTILETLDFQNSQTLVAFTHGRGAFRTELAPCPACMQRDGDLDFSGAVDVNDYARFALCVTGPANASRPAACDPCDFTNADLMTDGSIDLRDFATLQRLFVAP